MARPSNRYARAQARARYRKPKRSSSSLAWNVAIVAIVVLGVGGIVLSRLDLGNAAPEVGDHWHASLDVNVCNTWLGVTPEFENDINNPNIRAGLHSHGDGLIHIHPFGSGEAGDNATIDKFLEYQDFDLSEDSLALWEGDPKQNGDVCDDGQPGTLRWYVNSEEKHGDPGDYRPEDGDRIVISFNPESVALADLGTPPNQARLPNPVDETPQS
jgi:hypothetical protein